MTSLKIIQTEDGSQSLYNAELNETYHSFHGALTESKHVFIEHGLNYLHRQRKKHIRILEVGFGTGLNALLTQVESLKQDSSKIEYVTLEPFPIDQSVLAELKYAELIDGITRDDFIALHSLEWEKEHTINPRFSFLKCQTQLQGFQSEKKFDLIYYDAFAPSKQSEMWTFELLKRVASLMNSSGVLVTYCAKGQFKRDLSQLNMQVETLPGPPGKKEMVRGVSI